MAMMAAYHSVSRARSVIASPWGPSTARPCVSLRGAPREPRGDACPEPFGFAHAASAHRNRCTVPMSFREDKRCVRVAISSVMRWLPPRRALAMTPLRRDPLPDAPPGCEDATKRDPLRDAPPGCEDATKRDPLRDAPPGCEDATKRDPP